ncbi:hypothetical protein MSG28_009964 [Choristoneura fumiferana]|uniref:Uncharacterized protein n=1 Tax=Choristoneura fumiferana TaxID=7141 RepID=A0ACC0JD89_CHOFU|nr:hypothetical protein MSG28_009964 [Choristoneura fumiferana]
MNTLLTSDDKVQAVKILSDGCRILSDLHFVETLKQGLQIKKSSFKSPATSNSSSSGLRLVNRETGRGPPRFPSSSRGGHTSTYRTMTPSRTRIAAAPRSAANDDNALNECELPPANVQKYDSNPEPWRQRWFYGGKLLGDRLLIEEAKITPGYVVQVIVSTEPQPPS